MYDGNSTMTKVHKMVSVKYVSSYNRYYHITITTGHEYRTMIYRDVNDIKIISEIAYNEEYRAEITPPTGTK